MQLYGREWEPKMSQKSLHDYAFYLGLEDNEVGEILYGNDLLKESKTTLEDQLKQLGVKEEIKNDEVSN